MTHIKQRYDTAADWTSANLVLMSGEVGWESDTRKAKIGDGVTAWNALPYAVESLDTLAPLDSPDLTGSPTAPTPFTSDDSTRLATTEFVQNVVDDGNFAPLASPALTGNPTAPTPATADSDTSIATTAFVKSVLAALAEQSAPFAGAKTLTPVRVASIANVSLTGLQTVDGVALAADDRVLLRYQSADAENGVWLAKTGAWVRAADADTASETPKGTQVAVLEGSASRLKVFTLTSTVVTMGTTTQFWSVTATIPQGGTFDYPTSPSSGQMYFNTSNKVLSIWDGAAWKQMGPFVCTSTTRPSFPNNEMVIFETDTGRQYIYISSAWVLMSDTGVWTSYTPTWQGSTTNPVLGNGTLVGSFARIGKTVHYRIVLTMGSTTTYGSGSWSLLLPSLPVVSRQRHTTDLLDSSAGGPWSGSAVLSGGRITLFVPGATAGVADRAVTPTIPFTFAVGDVITVTGTYEEA